MKWSDGKYLETGKERNPVIGQKQRRTQPRGKRRDQR